MEHVLVDFWRLVRGNSKHGRVWWALWTVVFLALAVLYFVRGSHHWMGYLWGVGALVGLSGLVFSTLGSPPHPEDRDPGPGH